MIKTIKRIILFLVISIFSMSIAVSANTLSNLNLKRPTISQLLDTVEKTKKRDDVGLMFFRQILKFNNRLDYYDMYIKLAKKEGYVVTSYEDYLENYKYTDQKVLILRHDIDETSPATKKMFEIERNNKVKATYYFRWCTFDKSLIQEISKAGFEVSLHYETVATYMENTGKRTMTENDVSVCRKNLKAELRKFQAMTGIKVKTIASHGNPLNAQTNYPNWKIFEGEDYSDYGLIGETYDKDILKNYIASYICDRHLYYNYGYSYASNPIDSILSGKQVIEFLSHPNHWDFTEFERNYMFLAYPNSTNIID